MLKTNENSQNLPTGIEFGDQSGRYLVARDAYIGDMYAIRAQNIRREMQEVADGTYGINIRVARENEKSGLPLKTLFTAVGELGLMGAHEAVVPGVTEDSQFDNVVDLAERRSKKVAQTTLREDPQPLAPSEKRSAHR